MAFSDRHPQELKRRKRRLSSSPAFDHPSGTLPETFQVLPRRDGDYFPRNYQYQRPPRWMLLLCFIASFRASNFLVGAFVPTNVYSSAAQGPMLAPLDIREQSGSSSYLKSTSSKQSELQALTVKELKQLVKEGRPEPPERGLLSKLKKKQDLIDYLEANPPIMNGAQENGSNQHAAVITNSKNGKSTQYTSHARVEQESKPKPKKSPPLRMPKLDSNTESMQQETSSYVENDSDTTIPAPKRQLSPRDVTFEKVFQRYPPIRDQHTATEQLQQEQKIEDEEELEEEEYPEDIRQIYHPIFQSTKKSCDMDIVFVGTASCSPGVTRGVSCTALRMKWKRRAAFQDPNERHASGEGGFQGGTWLFDVGECTQLQVQKTSSVKPSKITKIFVTHAHGDHSFGLPGLLCLMGQVRDRASEPVDIYGPEGLRMWLRVAIRYSVSRIVPPYRVHELKDVPMAPEWQFIPRQSRYSYRGLSDKRPKRWGTQGLPGEDPNNWISQADRIKLEPNSQYGEVPGGRDIYPIYDHPLSSDGAPIWEVEDEEDVKVYAGPMSHGIPCVGYVVEEASRPGRLRNEIVEPMVKRNIQALKENGFTVPMKAMAVIKNLPVGSSFTFPDGSVITQEEAVEPPRKGRKVVICGDTASSRALEVLAQDADVLVHESTNAYLRGIDKQTDFRSVTKDTIIHGHSTPEVAGHFARKTNAKRLLLNHFSARYKGDPSLDSLSVMLRIEEQAISASDLNQTQVAAAWDLMVLPIPSE